MGHAVQNNRANTDAHAGLQPDQGTPNVPLQRVLIASQRSSSDWAHHQVPVSLGSILLELL